ncbi:PREDICTED: B-box zinc finger protein 32 [Fragaria vesca subsp. vesca]|uniref:B-box zinc finger protein 32 n=1 Tax=Fragaria vesca subsp. vesca TaxID=101020 RepID=UPI0002C31439|nr:PREDICTED: B-box zinc finger protein 32 [Fragaria vesca subsp. vesca]
MKDRMCELCDQRAALYCASDSAFLCFRCDSRVHSANFLVARHVRQPLCSNCKSLAGYPISGDGVRTDHWLCSSCSPEDFSGDDDDSLLSSSLDSVGSACASSTDQSLATTTTGKVCPRRSGSSVTEVSKGSYVPARFSARFMRRRMQRVRSADARAEGTFVNWCKKLGMSSGDSAVVVSSASHALGFCLARLPGVPLRVALAASFWFGVRICGDRAVSTCQNLRRVEEISGVPVKLILAVDAKLGRELRTRRGRPEIKEGWAEC